MPDCDVVTAPYELDFVSAIPNNIDDGIVDTFTRTVANGWGTADTGQVWATSGGVAGDFSVAGGQGVHSLPAVNSSRSTNLTAVDMPDVDIVVSVTPSVTAAGASIRAAAVVRRASDGSSHYRFEAQFNPGGTVTAVVSRLGGGSADLDTAVVPGTHAGGVKWRIRGQAIGALLRMKAWPASGEEPISWQAGALDTAWTTGQVGVRSMLAAGNTNVLPVTVAYDDLSVEPGVGAIQDADSQVLLSLHEDPWCVTHESRFDPPTPRYAEVSSMLADGSRYPSIVYSNRTLELRLACQAANPDALAAQLQELARQLHFGVHGDGRSILRFSDKTSEPVYFRTFRVSPVDIDIITQGQRSALVNVDIPAEPYAYGAREFYQALTVTNNPATGIANPMYFDLTGVKGDADTPLMLMSTGTAFGTTSVIAVRRRGNPDDMPFVLQAELADQFNGSTTLQPFDANYSGSGSNHVSVDLAATASQTIRITFGDLPDIRTVDGRGDYRVLIRVNRSNNTSTILANTIKSAADTRGDQVEIPQSLGLQIVDLGVIAVPFGTDPIYDGLSGQQVPVFGQNFGIELECTSAPVSGCGTVDIDYVLLTPADDAWLNVRWANSGIGNAAESIIDSVHEAVWFRDDQGALLAVDPSPVVGGFPYISPAETNRIFTIMAVVGPDTITDTYVFVASYWPRYLNPVRPISS